MTYEEMVSELMALGYNVAYSNGIAILDFDDGTQQELNLEDASHAQIFHAMYEDTTGKTVNVVTESQDEEIVRPGVGTDQEKARWAAMGWDFDRWGPLPSKIDPLNPEQMIIDDKVAETQLKRLIENDPEVREQEARQRRIDEGRTNLEIIQEQQDRIREQSEREAAAAQVQQDRLAEQQAQQAAVAFRPEFDVDQLGRTIVRTTPGGAWRVVESQDDSPQTIEEYEFQLLREGRYDEAAKLDQIVDQLRSERLTPERAAEMLVGISYSPSDFKAMMDAMLGQNTQLDTTVDIGALQEQAASMLRGDDPLILQGGPVPPELAPGVAPEMLIPTPRPETAFGLEQISTAQAGNIPARENMLFQPTEGQEFGMGATAAPQPSQPIFNAPAISGNRVLSPEIAAIGANAVASAERAAMERSAQDEEIRRIQNTPFTSTAEKLKAMEEVMGPRAALYMRNQRLLQPQQQQLFEARRPLTRRYV